MRIAFISYEYPPGAVIGGIGTYTKQVALLLKTGNFEVHIFAGSPIQSGKTVENGIVVHRVQCTGPHDFQQKVRELFETEHRQQPFALVESPEINANAIEIKRLFPLLPLIVRLHAPNYLVEGFKKKYVPFKNKARFFLGAIRRGKWDPGYWRRYDYQIDPDYLFVQMAEHISAPTFQMKEWAVLNWNIQPDRIRVIENPFIENDVFKTAITGNDEKVIIFYGRLNVLKGLITATRAMKHILINNPGWKWIIVGDDGAAPDGKTSMKDWMKRHLKQVAGQVTFYMAVPNEQLPFYLRQASIVLIPSLFESYSYVTIEAMCAGKAIVGSRYTGIASLIENNITGKLADPYKVAEWESAIRLLIKDIPLRKRLGNAAASYVESKHSINKEILGYYLEVSRQTFKP